MSAGVLLQMSQIQYKNRRTISFPLTNIFICDIYSIATYVVKQISLSCDKNLKISLLCCNVIDRLSCQH
jgi:hypothetical protein